MCDISSGKEHGNADGLSRSPDPPMNKTNDDEDFIDSLIMYVSPEDVRLTDLEIIRNYLSTFSWPPGASNTDLKRLRRKVQRYCMLGGQ